MKKIFVILSVFFLFSYIVSSKEEEYKDLGYNYYYVKKDNITLENLNEKFKDIEIVNIHFYIHPVYKKSLNLKYTNHNKLKELYLKFLKQNNMYSEYNKYLVMPIKINKVLVYDDYNNLIKKGFNIVN